MDFLRNRQISTELGPVMVERGCPQGSCLGPVIWLPIMEEWFNLMERCKREYDGIHAQAFADDQLLIISGTSVKNIEKAWVSVEKACLEWAARNELEYAADKTAAMFIPAKGRIREPSIKMDGNRIPMSDHIKYLGVIIDTGLLFIEHARQVRSKVAACGHKILAVTGKSWGASSETMKIVYQGAIKPMLIYGAEIWGHRASDSRIKRHMDAAQRPFLLAITKAYRTTSTPALQALAGCPPLSCEAWKNRSIFHRCKDPYVDISINPDKKRHPANRSPIQYTEHQQTPSTHDTGTWIFTDAGRKDTGDSSDGETRGGIVAYKKGQIIGRKIAIITGCPLTHIAELQTIIWGLEQGLRVSTEGQLNIVTDSKVALDIIANANDKYTLANSARILMERGESQNRTVRLFWARRENPGIQEADKTAATDDPHTPSQRLEGYHTRHQVKKDIHRQMIDKWQEDWDKTDKGRLTHDIIPKIGDSRYPLSHRAVQLTTGHGNFKSYLKRFKLQPTDGACDCGDEDTALHRLYQCKLDKISAARDVFQRQQIQIQGSFPLLLTKTTKEEEIRNFNTFAQEIVEDDNEMNNEDQ